MTACIAPYAHTSAETPNAARAAPYKSTGIVYRFVLQAVTRKKLSEIPNAAAPGVPIHGSAAVITAAAALTRHARRRARTGASPRRIHANDSHPPANAPKYAEIGMIHVCRAACGGVSRYVRIRYVGAQFVHRL